MCIIIAMGVPYTTMVMQGTPMGFSTATPAAFFLLFVLLATVHVVLGWLRREWAFHWGELVTITIMMMVAADLDANALETALADVVKAMGLTLHIDSMQGGLHQHITPNLIVRVSGADRAGIVARVTGALAEAGFNILDLESDVAGSPENPVYIMQIVGISETPLEELEAAVRGMRDEGIEVNISPLETLVG